MAKEHFLSPGSCRWMGLAEKFERDRIARKTQTVSEVLNVLRGLPHFP
jgi:hypothetical protein